MQKNNSIKNVVHMSWLLMQKYTILKDNWLTQSIYLFYYCVFALRYINGVSFKYESILYFTNAY